jgi:hypothetical protein
MQKIKTVFVVDRSQRPHRITDQVQADWVIVGEGLATVKYDGTACLIQDGKLFRRYDAKPGRMPPEGFTPCQDNPDPVSGHFPGWVPVTGDPADKFHLEAFDKSLPDGTYELLGPKIQGNRYGLSQHQLRRHGADTIEVDRSFDAIRNWLEASDHEGLVFHHPDGRMAKIRRKDFGFKW